MHDRSIPQAYQMQMKSWADLPKLVSGGDCQLSLCHHAGHLILRVMLPDSFARLLPKRSAYVNKRLKRAGRGLLPRGKSVSGPGWVGIEWPCPAEAAVAIGVIAIAKGLFRQLRACIFQPVPLDAALKTLAIDRVDVASLPRQPALRLSCERHGKRYSVPAYPVSDFLALSSEVMGRRDVKK